jgi:hypothetical protein
VGFEVIVYPGPKLEAGHHIFPFTFILPNHLPSSFEGQYGHVRYYVQVKQSLTAPKENLPLPRSGREQVTSFVTMPIQVDKYVSNSRIINT